MDNKMDCETLIRTAQDQPDIRKIIDSYYQLDLIREQVRQSVHSVQSEAQIITSNNSY